MRPDDQTSANQGGYTAIWVVGGEAFLVYPRGKRRSFTTKDDALKALDKRARNFPHGTRGIVLDPNGNQCSTIAL